MSVPPEVSDWFLAQPYLVSHGADDLESLLVLVGG